MARVIEILVEREHKGRGLRQSAAPQFVRYLHELRVSLCGRWRFSNLLEVTEYIRRTHVMDEDHGQAVAFREGANRGHETTRHRRGARTAMHAAIVKAAFHEILGGREDERRDLVIRDISLEVGRHAALDLGVSGSVVNDRAEPRLRCERATGRPLARAYQT